MTQRRITQSFDILHYFFTKIIFDRSVLFFGKRNVSNLHILLAEHCTHSYDAFLGKKNFDTYFKNRIALMNKSRKIPGDFSIYFIQELRICIFHLKRKRKISQKSMHWWRRKLSHARRIENPKARIVLKTSLEIFWLSVDLFRYNRSHLAVGIFSSAKETAFI